MNKNSKGNEHRQKKKKRKYIREIKSYKPQYLYLFTEIIQENLRGINLVL